jgi:hypothetical protein
MATKQNLAEAFAQMLGYNPGGYKEASQPSFASSLLGNMTTSPATSRGIGGTGGTGLYNGDYTPAWDTMTNAEKAAYYAENPTMSAMTQLGQKGFGYTGLGMAQNYFNPDFVNEQSLIAKGIDPAANQAAIFSNRGSELLQGRNNEDAQYPPASQDMLNSFNQAYAQENSYDPSNDQGVMSGGMPSDSGQDQAGGEAASASGGDNAGDASPDGYAKGGRVDRNRLRGPDPKGPDQGYAPLQSGEYVIKRDAVRKYGEGMLGKINSGKFAKR